MLHLISTEIGNRFLQAQESLHELVLDLVYMSAYISPERLNILYKGVTTAVSCNNVNVCIVVSLSRHLTFI